MIGEKGEEFLRESNAIEREYSEEAFEDAKQAWICGVLSLEKNEPISYSLILAIHRRLMKRLNPRIAGKLREVEVQVGYRICMPHFAVKNHLKELCTRNPKTEEDIRIYHILFEQIHPFEDGNGRTGRIIMNLQRLRAGLPLLIIHTGDEQQKYYKWFN